MESGNAPEAASKPQPSVSEKKSTQPSMPVPDLVSSVSTSAAKAESPAKSEPAASPKKASPPAPKAPEADAPAVTAKQQPGNAPAPATTPAKAVPTSVANEAPPSKGSQNKGREEKGRKKDDKSVDHVLRALNSLNTTEEKLAAMCKKYADLFDEHRKLQVFHKQTEKRCSVLQREKEQLQGEHNKAILTRSRLENLCRELQRQNKAIKDESLLRIREEEEKRKEVAAKFQSTMNEISTMMQQNNDKNIKLRDDNIDMTSKLKSICEQYEIRQQQVDRISKQMQLEQQLNDAKMSKLKMEMSAEREMLLREKQQLLMEVQQYQQRCTDMQTTEVSLRGQITMYNDKYDEFQKALARSNDVFGGFKGEMEKMTKKICKLEKETSSWKQRWERSHAALLEMGADKQRAEQERDSSARQLAALQSLCRTLQQERAATLAILKAVPGGGQEVPVTPGPDRPELRSTVPETAPNGPVADPKETETSATEKTADSAAPGTKHPDARTLQMVKNIVNCVNEIGAELKFSPDDPNIKAFNNGIPCLSEPTNPDASASCQRLQNSDVKSPSKPAAASDSSATPAGDSPPNDLPGAGKVCASANQKSVIVENSSAPAGPGTGGGECAKFPDSTPAVVEPPPQTPLGSLCSTPGQTPAVGKSPPVANGVAHTVENGALVPEAGKPQPSTPLSPDPAGAPGKPGDCGKKTKEAAKKKKK